MKVKWLQHSVRWSLTSGGIEMELANINCIPNSSFCFISLHSAFLPVLLSFPLSQPLSRAEQVVITGESFLSTGLTCIFLQQGYKLKLQHAGFAHAFPWKSCKIAWENWQQDKTWHKLGNNLFECYKKYQNTIYFPVFSFSSFRLHTFLSTFSSHLF